MPRLAIDTSSSLTSIAIEKACGEIFFEEISTRDSHSQRIASMVESLCKQAAINSSAEFSQIVVGIGPGSFTGLRIGLSFAKGISWAYKIPIVGIQSFVAIARAHHSSAKRICVMSDARREEYFFAAYRWHESSLVEDCELQICRAQQIAKYLESVQEHSPILLTNDLQTTPRLQCEIQNFKKISTGLLKHPIIQTEQWSIAELSLIDPHYLREVSALTIEDRRLRGML